MNVKVYCVDASHPAKRERVFIAEFSKSDATWLPSAQRRSHPGIKWWFNEDHSVHREPDAGDFALTRVDMTCRYCKRPLTLRLGKLDAALTLIADAGREHVTLSELRAILDTSRK